MVEARSVPRDSVCLQPHRVQSLLNHRPQVQTHQLSSISRGSRCRCGVRCLLSSFGGAWRFGRRFWAWRFGRRFGTRRFGTGGLGRDGLGRDGLGRDGFEGASESKDGVLLCEKISANWRSLL